MIYWLTGQPGSGKTTLGNWLIAALGGEAVLVDGDDIREIFENKDYSEQGRRKNIELAQNIAHFLHIKKQVCKFTSLLIQNNPARFPVTDSTGTYQVESTL